MARQTTSVPSLLWRDPEFLTLALGPQRLYLALATQPELDWSGHMPLTKRRWAAQAEGYTVRAVEADLDALEGAGFVAVDNDVEEILVRPLVAPAGHKQLQAALKATLGISSKRLRLLALEYCGAVGHDSNRRTSSKRSVLAAARITVHGRDGYRCVLCGWAPNVPEEYDGRYALGFVHLDPMSGQYKVRILELDHIHPESLGGLFEIDNLQTLCNSCNASKGARTE